MTSQLEIGSDGYFVNPIVKIVENIISRLKEKKDKEKEKKILVQMNEIFSDWIKVEIITEKDYLIKELLNVFEEFS
jgi:hypothetical protein